MKLLQSGNMKNDTHRSVSPTQIYCRATFWSVILNDPNSAWNNKFGEDERFGLSFNKNVFLSLFWISDIIEQLEEDINHISLF